MKKTELEGVYQVACSAKGFQPNGDQFKVWWKVLGACERPDLEGALMAWFAAHVEFPMPAELRVSADALRRLRTAKVTTYFQQQVCPKCKGVAAMMRPIGEQFRTWCLPCQTYRKIVPEDIALTDAEWQMVCVELGVIFAEWVRHGKKYHECVNPQLDRERVRGGFQQTPLELPVGLR
jgi:hypothetical protein